jgi:hypothetical protein
MIFHSHQAIFLHIGKTAGTAIERVFLPAPRNSKLANRDILAGFDKELGIFLAHASLKTVKQLAPEDLFEKYFKFSIVRNPYARLVSAFNYTCKLHIKRFGSFHGYIRSLPERVESEAAERGAHITPQVRYTHQNGKQAIDLIGRFEELDTAMIVLSKRLGMSAPIQLGPKPRRKVRPEHVSMASYDDELIAIMQKVYREDFDLLGYSGTPNREAGGR